MPDLVSLLIEDIISLPTGTANEAWGIYLNGLNVIPADSVVSFEYQNEYSLSTYPQEQGAFQTYDKVTNPFTVRFVFAKGGSLVDRQSFIEAIETVSEDYNLYDVVTPEKVYTSVNLFHNSYSRRSNSGLGLIQYEVWGLQVNVTGTETLGASATPTATSNGTQQIGFENTANPASANSINGGFVQGQSASSDDVSSVGIDEAPVLTIPRLQ